MQAAKAARLATEVAAGYHLFPLTSRRTGRHAAVPASSAIIRDGVRTDQSKAPAAASGCRKAVNIFAAIPNPCCSVSARKNKNHTITAMIV